MTHSLLKCHQFPAVLSEFTPPVRVEHTKEPVQRGRPEAEVEGSAAGRRGDLAEVGGPPASAQETLQLLEKRLDGGALAGTGSAEKEKSQRRRLHSACP